MKLFQRLFTSKRIYLDHASATPVDPDVFAVMKNFMKEHFANPSAIYKEAVFVRGAIDNARKNISEIINAHSDEIIFTSGGTESIHIAILGVLRGWVNQNTSRLIIPHIITTEIEHPSVKELCYFLLKTKQADITFVPVLPNGIVDPSEIKKALRPETILVSVMYVNNEIGTIQPISEIAKIIRHYKKHYSTSDIHTPILYPLFHTDAAQATNYLSLNVSKLHVDLMSCNGSKIYGPKGSGFLYKKRDIPFISPISGGGQEFGFRSGTENTVGIVGISKALSIVEKIKDKENSRLSVLRDYMIRELEKNDGVVLNGDKDNRLPNNINISVSGIPSELLVLEFDARGISVSSKSACQSDDPNESYVLQSIRPDSSISEGTIRFSLGRATTKNEIDRTISVFSQIIKKLRPYYPYSVVSLKG